MIIPNLRILLLAMSQPGAFYILGAGASAGLVPFTRQLRESVREAFWSIGMYPASCCQRTTLFDRVIGEPQVTSLWDRQELILQHIAPAVLDLLVQREFSYPLDSVIPPQYRLLQQVAAPGAFFNFNLDGMGRAFLATRHRVFEPHGVIDREWTEASNFPELLEIALDMQLPHLRPKVLPGPEPLTITGTDPYHRARRWLRQAPAVIILGYSFGKVVGSPSLKRCGTGLDDAESFEYVAEHLLATPCPVLVVSPDPSELTGLLEERLHSLRVVPVPLYWDRFAKAAMSVFRPSVFTAQWGRREDQISELERAYVQELDKIAA